MSKPPNEHDKSKALADFDKAIAEIKREYDELWNRLSNVCTHPNIKLPAFDPEDAKNLDSWAIKKKYPRGYEKCPDCNESMIIYASWEHYIAGDW